MQSPAPHKLPDTGHITQHNTQHNTQHTINFLTCCILFLVSCLCVDMCVLIYVYWYVCIDMCALLQLATDMNMDPIPGFEFANWERGYGDFHMVPDHDSLRRVAWWVCAHTCVPCVSCLSCVSCVSCVCVWIVCVALFSHSHSHSVTLVLNCSLPC